MVSPPLASATLDDTCPLVAAIVSLSVVSTKLHLSLLSLSLSPFLFLLHHLLSLSCVCARTERAKMAADSGMETCPSPEIADSRKRPLDCDTENGATKRSHYGSGISYARCQSVLPSPSRKILSLIPVRPTFPPIYIYTLPIRHTYTRVHTYAVILLSPSDFTPIPCFVALFTLSRAFDNLTSGWWCC